MPITFDESSHDSWWAGIRLPAIAVAVALASTLAPIKGQRLTQIAQSVATQQQDEFQFPTQHAGFYETRPAYTVLRWNIDPSENAAGLYGVPDDDLTRQSTIALSNANRYPQPWSVDTQFVIPPLQVDELYWQNPNQPLSRSFAYPQPWIGEQNEQAFGLHGLPDDDLTRQSVVGVAGRFNIYPQPWAVDGVSVKLYGLPDVDQTWDNPLKPLTRNFVYPQQATFDEQFEPLPLPSDDAEMRQSVLRIANGFVYPQPWSVDSQFIPVIATDQDFWDNPLKPSLRTLIWPQPWTFDVQEPAGSLFGTPDENELRQSVLSVHSGNVYVQPWSVDSQSVKLYGLPDEDQIWQNPLKLLTRDFRYQQQFVFDEETVSAPVQDDDLTRQSILKLSNALVYPQPFAFDTQTAFPSALDADFWINPNQPLVRLFIYPQQWTFDEQTPLLFGLPDENEIHQSLLALRSGNVYPQPWSTDSQFTGPLAFDSDFWINPLQPLVREFKWVQQWTFDDQSPVLEGTFDESELGKKVLSILRANVYPQPWGMDSQSTFPIIQVIGTVDEDFWTNAAWAQLFDSMNQAQRKIALRALQDVLNDWPTPSVPQRRRMYVTRMIDVLNLDAFPEKG